MKLLRDKGLLQGSDGALIVDVSLPEDKEPMPPMIIIKSDGGDVQDHRPGNPPAAHEGLEAGEIWHVVDSRQSFISSRFPLRGWLGLSETIPIGSFGTMNGKDGKPARPEGRYASLT